MKPTLPGCFYIAGSACFIVGLPAAYGGGCFIAGTVIGWCDLPKAGPASQLWYLLTCAAATVFVGLVAVTEFLPWIGPKVTAKVDAWVVARRPRTADLLAAEQAKEARR